MSAKHWLMKAEPDSRIVKGKDVKFSVDDFESVKTTPWEGVRNAEARNLMKEMKVGDKVLFYHSNCKNPGIAAFAEVSKEAYPDYTAWDSSHPYYDPKTDKENPKWYMVDVTFVRRAPHFVPLSLLRGIATSSEPPREVSYIGAEGVKAIQNMALVTRGRLSVQRVHEETWEVITQLAEHGGWDEEGTGRTNKAQAKQRSKAKADDGKQSRGKKTDSNEGDSDDKQPDGELPDTVQNKAISTSTNSRGRKRKADLSTEDIQPRRSTRVRK
ncbi:hypothetical protein BN946_scf185015.g170 [Trametes cinnabarina]|uniref:EVE domain-containing protein n=1 Tax=Pycnoporus cinnabarinus TaxID=5643 RepID=A0A060SI57_PYCCI|nr:hypothetical protein BN946_scf185015.g170 [Trametes cinnabarina]